MKVYIKTTQNVTYFFKIDHLDFKIDQLIDKVCKSELCPRSAIKEIKIKEIK